MNRCLNNLSEEEQLAAVQKDASIVFAIYKPSEAVQLAAVQQSGYAITLIPSPTEKVQLEILDFLFKKNYELPSNITSKKAIDKWNKLHEMKKACE